MTCDNDAAVAEQLFNVSVGQAIRQVLAHATVISSRGNRMPANAEKVVGRRHPHHSASRSRSANSNVLSGGHPETAFDPGTAADPGKEAGLSCAGCSSAELIVR